VEPSLAAVKAEVAKAGENRQVLDEAPLARSRNEVCVEPGLAGR